MTVVEKCFSDCVRVASIKHRGALGCFFNYAWFWKLSTVTVLVVKLSEIHILYSSCVTQSQHFSVFIAWVLVLCHVFPHGCVLLSSDFSSCLSQVTALKLLFEFIPVSRIVGSALGLPHSWFVTGWLYLSVFGLLQFSLLVLVGSSERCREEQILYPLFQWWSSAKGSQYFQQWNLQ